MRVVNPLFDFVERHRLGFVFGDNTGYALTDHDDLIPDVSYVSFARVPSLPQRLTVAPDLAVEVFSPSNRPREMLDKVHLYIRHGTRLVWVIYPDERVVDVYRPGDGGALHWQTLDMQGILDGADVLPGFTLSVKTLFPG
jgi:Uma2 family endonuclease